MEKKVAYTFEQAEQAVRANLVSSHPLLDEGIRATHELLFATVNATSRTVKHFGLPTIVSSQLFMKIFDDFRCASLVAFGGYPTQTAALVASLYESVFTLCYIGADEELASEWAGFKDATSSFRSVRELTKGGMTKMFGEVTSESVETEYTCYRQLCMAKHGNPIFQKTQGFAKQGGKVTLTFGPKSLESAEHVIRYSLGKSMMYTTWACSALETFQFGKDKNAEVVFLRGKVLSILERISDEIQKEREDT